MSEIILGRECWPQGLPAWGDGCWEGLWVGTCLGGVEHERGSSGLGAGGLFLTLSWAGMKLWILGMTFPMFQLFMISLGQMSDAVIYPALLDMEICV